MTKKVLKTLDDLREILPESERQEIEQKEQQVIKDRREKSWEIDRHVFSEMIAKKNRNWLVENAKTAEFDYYKEFPTVYKRIESMFSIESKRKFMIHLITNFLPLHRSTKVPTLRGGKDECIFTRYKLTDMKSIFTGDRDKHIAFTGQNTDVVLSGIAIQELERFVLKYTHDFNCQNGRIINHALDKERCKEKNINKGKDEKAKDSSPVKDQKTA
jgi:hypothetical protein